jgi:hypothetical protein
MAVTFVTGDTRNALAPMRRALRQPAADGSATKG